MSTTDPKRGSQPAKPQAPAKPRLVPLPEPWSPARATERIREKARDESFTPSWKYHALEQMEERGLFTPDVLYVLKKGFVYKEAIPATQPLLFRYAINSPTPNSNGREVRVIVIPSPGAPAAKIISVMWADEPLVGGKS